MKKFNGKKISTGEAWVEFPNEEKQLLAIQEMNDAEVVRNILEDVMVYPKIIESKNVYKLYLKKAEQIRDFLNYIGAINNLFAFEDSRIKRDYNNYVNRIINCDIANEEKVIKNAKKQIEQIKYLQKHYGFSHLTPRLMDAVILRNTFPDYSLSGLSDESFETLGRYISKSGLSHCFKDIEKLYLDIKAKKEQ